MILLLVLVTVSALAALALARNRVTVYQEPIVTTPPPDPVTVPSDAPRSSSPGDMAQLIRRVAEQERYGRPELAIAIAKVESSLNPFAVNPNDSAPIGVIDDGDSFGLMGLKVPTARYFCPWVAHGEDLYDPETNATAGIRFLVQLSVKWETQYGLDGVIQMYNLGETRFLRGERAPDYLARVRAKL